VEDLEPSQEDKSYKNSKFQCVRYRKMTNLATIIGSSNCRVSLAVSLLFTKAESGRFRFSLGKAMRSASNVLR